MNKCRCCGRIATEPWSDNLERCKACGSYLTYPALDPKTASWRLKEHKKSIPEFDEQFDWRVFLLRALLPGKGGVLQGDAPGGRFSRILRDEGYKVDNLKGVAVARTLSSYDAVILWDMLENSPNPRKLVESLIARLKVGGLLLIRIIDSGSLKNTEEGAVRVDWGHMNYLSQTSLEALILNTLGVLPIFVQVEQYGEDFLICVVRKGPGKGHEPSRRVLMVAHSDAYLYLDSAPGPRMRILKTLLKLREKGLAVDLAVTRSPQVKIYDVVHIFHHAWRTVDHVQQAICAKSHGKPLIVSTIYMDLSETTFAQIAVPKIFNIALEKERETYLKAMADGELALTDFTQKSNLPIYPGIQDDQRALFNLADHLIGLSFTEIRQIGLTLGIHKPFSIVPNCADPAIFRDAEPDTFVENHGVDDFVITVGHMEVRKNQLMLLYALRKTDIPVVVVGNPYRRMSWYYDLCRSYASKKVLFIPQLSQKELASAFAAARVHALPSWAEGVSLAHIEAAMSGCNVVASNRGGELEYFGDEGIYCSPASVSSIRDAVQLSYRLGDQARRKRLQAHVVHHFTFETAAQKTIAAYEKTLSEVAYGR